MCDSELEDVGCRRCEYRPFGVDADCGWKSCWSINPSSTGLVEFGSGCLSPGIGWHLTSSPIRIDGTRLCSAQDMTADFHTHLGSTPAVNQSMSYPFPLIALC